MLGLSMAGDFDAAITAGEAAVDLEPSNVDALERLALSFAWSGNVHHSGICPRNRTFAGKY